MRGEIHPERSAFRDGKQGVFSHSSAQGPHRELRKRGKRKKLKSKITGS